MSGHFWTEKPVTSLDPSASAPAQSADSSLRGDASLEGNIGVLSLMFTVLAYNAPLTVFIGGIPVIMLVGNGLGAPAALLAGGVLVGLVAFGLTTMSSRLRRSGGFYSFISVGLGKVVGLGAAFAAVVCYFVALLLAVAFGGINANAAVVNLFHGPDVAWWVWGFGLLALTAVLGHFNVNLSAGVLSFFLVAELLLMVAYIVSVVAQGGGPEGFGLESFRPTALFSGSWAVAFMLGVGMFGGFEATVIFRDEVRTPDRTIPRATYGVVALMALLYALAAWVFINSYGGAAVMKAVVADSVGAATSSIKDYTGTWAYDLTILMLVTSSFALLLAAHNITGRYLYNLSADGILPRQLSAVHPRHKSPYRASVAVAVASAVALLLFVVFRVDQLTIYARLAGVYSYTLLVILVVVALAITTFLFRSGEGGRTRAAAISSLVGFTALCAVLVLATWNFTLLSGATGVLKVVLLLLIWGTAAAGLGLGAWLRGSRPEVYVRIGREPAA